MQTCKYCERTLPEDNFEIAVRTETKVYRRKKCKQCKQKTQNSRRKKTSTWLQDYKKTLSCKQCGFSDYRALQFHHKDPSEKEFEISNGLTLSISRIKKEIEKCSVLCANCHCIEHSRM